MNKTNIYHENDKEGLRMFLQQPSAIEGETNGEQLGLKKSDMSDWKNNEEWVDKIEGITWNDESPKRLIEIKWWKKELARTLDAGKWKELTKLDCLGNKLIALNVRGNWELKDLLCGDNQLTVLDVSANKKLETLLCCSNQLSTLDVSENEKLKKLVWDVHAFGNQENNKICKQLDKLFLPKFLDSQLTEDDIISAIAFTHTLLTLTYVRGIPFEIDPDFLETYINNIQLFKDPKSQHISYATYEGMWRERHNEEKAELLIEIGYENSKVLWHYHQLKNSNMKLALGPAFRIIDYAQRLNINHIVIWYCYCLLKDESGILDNQQMMTLITMLGSNSMGIGFEEGLEYMRNRMGDIYSKLNSQ